MERRVGRCARAGCCMLLLSVARATRTRTWVWWVPYLTSRSTLSSSGLLSLYRSLP